MQWRTTTTSKGTLFQAYRSHIRLNRGQTLVEYGLIIAMVSIVAILVLQSLGRETQQLYQHIDNQIDQANSYSG